MRYEDYTKEELIRILEVRERPNCKTPADLNERIFNKWQFKEQEFFIVVSLDSALNVIAVHEVTKGLANRTLAHPREVFRPAILDNANAVILAHNHPSGNLTPSADDIELTMRMKRAGSLIGIEVLDHVIFGFGDFHSMNENGDLI